MERYACSVEGCNISGPVEKMWALSLKNTGDKAVAICSACGLAARREGIWTFPLKDTLCLLDEQKRKRLEARTARNKGRQVLFSAVKAGKERGPLGDAVLATVGNNGNKSVVAVPK